MSLGIDKIVSADDHLQETSDLWQKRLPAHLRDKAPHVVTTSDGYASWAWGNNPPRPFGMDVWGDRVVPKDRDVNLVRLEEIAPSTYEPGARLKAMDRDHVAAAILYPNYSRIFIGIWITSDSSQDPELFAACVRAYNDHLREFCSAAPKRLIPIGILPMANVEVALQELNRIGKMGIRGALIPQIPATGKFWNDPDYDVLWDTFAEYGMSINMHIGSHNGFSLPAQYHAKSTEGAGSRGGKEVAATLTRMSNSIPITTMLWSGVFDKHPSLKLVSVESDIGWLAYVRMRMEWVFKNFEWRHNAKPSIKNHPGYYFGRNLLATFQEDLAGIQARDVIGVDALCWASDFPHPETTLPKTLEYVKEQFAGVPERDVRKILVENAARCYNLDIN